MAAFRISQAADADLYAIAAYTERTWGQLQAKRYLAAFQRAFERLAASPGLGRAAVPVRPGLRRAEQGSRIIFYRHVGEAIVISRVLHKRMLPAGKTFPL